MRYRLKDYQEDAVRDILDALAKCRASYHADGDRWSFALSATTGSGKTVIAATVIEALVHGSTEFDVDPDPGAVVLWVSKDPALNEQTRARIRAAADRIPVGDLVLLDKDFAGDRLEKGTVYFINPAKLTAKALFVKRTNDRQFTFWDILDNTIREESATLYVILDEAHEGMKAPPKAEAAERQTIVQQIISGNGTHPPVPIVWGISATPKRFDEAMSNVAGRNSRANIIIDPKRVQASGLIKHTVALDIPDEAGDFDTAMVRDAALEFVTASDRWAEYGEREKLEEPVLPLLVVQIPNKSIVDADDQDDTAAEKRKRALAAEDRLILTVLDVVRKHNPGFKDDSVAHVIGERDDIAVGSYAVPKIKPQDVQDSTHIRVLVAKDAISTGWDCPRAEVLVSLRPGRDKTYITQLLGRMLRTPLARSTDDDRLNSAACFLPKFDRDNARAVAEEVMGIKPGEPFRPSPEGPVGPRVLFKPVDLAWNTEVPIEVRHVLAKLPSMPKPAERPRPLKRAIQAATALAHDDLVDDPQNTLLTALCGVLDGAMAQYATDVQQITDRILEAEVRRYTARHGDERAEGEQLSREADENTVDEAFRAATRAFSTTVAKAYVKRMYNEAAAADPHADLMAIKARVAALARIVRDGEPVVVHALEDAAEAQTRGWLNEKYADIAELGDERKSVYEDIRGLAREPEPVSTQLKEADRVEGAGADGTALKRYRLHLLADIKGEYPYEPDSSWEPRVLEQELSRKSVVGWYRNPSTASPYSVRVPYKADGKWKSLQPDFVMFTRNTSDGTILPAIVDPHSRGYSGALERLIGLANYAADHGQTYSRIECIDVGKDKKALRSLDMKDPKVRGAVLSAVTEGQTAADLFNGPLARNY